MLNFRSLTQSQYCFAPPPKISLSLITACYFSFIYLFLPLILLLWSSLFYPQLLIQPTVLITIFPAATRATEMAFSGSSALLWPHYCILLHLRAFSVLSGLDSSACAQPLNDFKSMSLNDFTSSLSPLPLCQPFHLPFIHMWSWLWLYLLHLWSLLWKLCLHLACHSSP